MFVRFKSGLLVVSAESEAEQAEIARFVGGHAEHAFHLKPQADKGFTLHDLGPREEACREPINVVSDMGDLRFRPIGNLSHAPFVLHGRPYASVEGFWQCLKVDAADARARIASLSGVEAKQSTQGMPERETLTYEGRPVRVGRPDHWALMRQACTAKFTQNETARNALLATGHRPLTHSVRRDSQTIPGVVMADIWMRIRTLLQTGRLKAGAAEEPVETADGPPTCASE